MQLPYSITSKTHSKPQCLHDRRSPLSDATGRNPEAGKVVKEYGPMILASGGALQMEPPKITRRDNPRLSTLFNGCCVLLMMMMIIMMMMISFQALLQPSKNEFFSQRSNKRVSDGLPGRKDFGADFGSDSLLATYRPAPRQGLWRWTGFIIWQTQQ